MYYTRDPPYVKAKIYSNKKSHFDVALVLALINRALLSYIYAKVYCSIDVYMS